MKENPYAFSAGSSRGPSVVTIVAWIIYAFLIVPTVIVVPMSFGTSGELAFPPLKWGFDLYWTMLDPESGWLAASFRSFYIGILSALFATILGVSAAYGLARAQFRAKGALSFFLHSPLLIPHIVLALSLYLYFAYVLLSGSILALIIGHTLVTTPFVIVTTSAGLRHVDENLEIAARIMGASNFQIFYQIVMPLLLPAIISAALFAFLLSFDEVVVAWFVGRSSDPTLPVKMYGSLQWEISPVLAAVSTVLIFITSLICFITAVLQPGGTSHR